MIYSTLKVALCADCPPGPVVKTLHQFFLHMGWIVGLQAIISAHVHDRSVDGDVLTAILAPSFLKVSRKGKNPSGFFVGCEFDGESDPIVVEATAHFLRIH